MARVVALVPDLMLASRVEGSLRAGGENFHIVEVWCRIDSKPDKKD